MSSSIIKSDNGVTSGVTGIVQTAGSDGTLLLQTTTSGGTATTAVTIDNSQKVTFANTIGFGSNAGITFNNSSALTNSTLNDYETGTWTPVLAFGGASVGITYTEQTGAYTKIGNVITLTCRMNISAVGSSTGNATITGMPFASPSGSASNAATPFAAWSLSGGSVTAPIVASYGSTLSLYHQPSGATVTALTKTQFGSTTAYIYFTLQYGSV